MSDSESEGGVPLIEAEFDPTANSKKRKAEAEVEGGIDSKKEKKKAKRKQKKQARAKNIDEDDLDQELGVNHAFERMDGQLVADYVNARTRLYGKDLSSVELEDKFIPARTVYDSTSYSDARKLDNLPAFLKKQFGNLKPTSNKPPGAPHTIVVTASGIRAADVCRSLKSGLPKQGIKDAKVEKLFAKHLKLADQIASLKKNRVDYGVGTPDRLAALLEEKALSTENLKRVVVDVSYIDQKKRGILDMKDLHEALVKLLLRGEFMGADREGGDELFVFY
ncbi:U3-containing 90S pre-ribosomal complex subunit-domain containing protein [Boeremia exigua]|uniref:U3-containing 90S pre-ribosomal complex subunit-domain containing protein n=1 Tax=Boeremia exigua TaxID=749465 RepID=UPI001E8CFB08|nr:U3-containing 90S pre-ribosomal complex subunit-domain containing protein [Boeremia exigua]KAH6619938.1 U3-containing 90S pre-ribosomal complex subunit-domain containing protein [Boeremia exigua]